MVEKICEVINGRFFTQLNKIQTRLQSVKLLPAPEPVHPLKLQLSFVQFQAPPLHRVWPAI